MSSGQYIYNVLLEAQPDGSHQASVLGWADCRAIADTPEDAVAALQKMLSDRITQAQIVQIEVPRAEESKVSASENPWVKYAGVFKDDPLFNEMLHSIEQYRQELDAELAEQESANVEPDGAA
jgi:predicted RNase H-like HicB family nuclease